MNPADTIKALSAEVEEVSAKLRSATAEISRLREALQQAGEDNAALRRVNAALAAQLGDGSNATLPASASVELAPEENEEYTNLMSELERTRAALAAAAAADEEPELEISVEAVNARKQQIEKEITQARETIEQAAMIRKQMAELERITNALSEENDRLRTECGEPVVAAEAPVAEPARATIRPMIRPLTPPVAGKTVEPAPVPAPAPAAPAAAEKDGKTGDGKLKVKAAAAQPATETTEPAGGRRKVFMQSLFGRNAG